LCGEGGIKLKKFTNISKPDWAGLGAFTGVLIYQMIESNHSLIVSLTSAVIIGLIFYYFSSIIFKRQKKQ
jgi:VIT1/CCC1 family predicted Fe2+/Mn2+ transporter